MSCVALALVTSRARWISLLKTTMTPLPRASSSAAVRTALKRLAGPSALIIELVRMAPVTMTGSIAPKEEIQFVGGLLDRIRAVGDDHAIGPVPVKNPRDDVC